MLFLTCFALPRANRLRRQRKLTGRNTLMNFAGREVSSRSVRIQLVCKSARPDLLHTLVQILSTICLNRSYHQSNDCASLSKGLTVHDWLNALVRFCLILTRGCSDLHFLQAWIPCNFAIPHPVMHNSEHFSLWTPKYRTRKDSRMQCHTWCRVGTVRYKLLSRQ
jgi:hypothetical protein